MTEEMTAIRTFLPALWRDLEDAGANLILVGGYALFQRQRHYENQAQTGQDRATIVPSAYWPQIRTTKDMDFIVPMLAMLPTVFTAMERVFKKHDFTVVSAREYTSFQRGECRFDLMAPQPNELQAEGIKMPKPGSDRLRPAYEDVPSPDLHARMTPELLFLEQLSPQIVPAPELGIDLRLAHPQTQLICKLVAAHDRHNTRLTKARASGDDAAIREHRQAWEKHGNDALRCLAMLEQQELLIIEAHLSRTPLQVRGPFGYQDFRSATLWQIAQLQRRDAGADAPDRSQWRPDDLESLRDALDLIKGAIQAAPVAPP